MENIGDLINKVSESVNEWKALQLAIKEVEEVINADRVILREHGINLSFDDFDKQAATQVVHAAPVIPSMPDPIGGDVGEDMSLEELEVMAENTEKDTRSAADIRKEAVTMTREVAQQDMTQFIQGTRGGF